MQPLIFVHISWVCNQIVMLAQVVIWKIVPAYCSLIRYCMIYNSINGDLNVRSCMCKLSSISGVRVDVLHSSIIHGYVSVFIFMGDTYVEKK